MKREIKFRIPYFKKGKFKMFTYWGTINHKGEECLDGSVFISPATVNGMEKGWHEQYTGLKDKNGKEIYEGDIFRVEEDGNGDPNDDRIYYLVIVWVQEWAMFCALNIESEYTSYLDNGIKALDEPMFWTYTLEDTSDRRFFLCGNIHENPELLNK